MMYSYSLQFFAMLKTYCSRIVVFLMLLFTSLSATAQVNFKVEYDSLDATYTVSYRSDVSYSTQLSITSSAQASIELPDSNFVVENFIAIDGSWNAPTIFEIENRYFLVSTMVSNTEFEYTAGVSKPFFSFQNAGICAGPLEIIDNDDPAFDNISINIGNQISILGFGRGNAFSGAFDTGSADCGVQQVTPPAIDTCDFEPVIVIETPSCSTATDGTITISTSSNSNLEYSINDGVNYQSASTFNNLGNGSYTIKVKDAVNNCEVGSMDNPITLAATNDCPLTPVDTTCLFQYLLAEQNGTYTVSMLSNVSYTDPNDIVASLQVSLQATTGQLSVDNIQNLQTAQFSSSQQINPSTSTGFDYYSFSISAPSSLPIVAGQTIPLFSFENANNCPTGNVQLIGDGDGLGTITIPGVDINPQITVSGYGAPDAPVCVGGAVLTFTNICNEDIDGDGVPNILEDQDGDGDFTNDDNDGDGTPNYLDDDDDNDRIPTLEEENAPNNGDGNGDGIADCLQDTVASQLAPSGAYRTLATGLNHPIFVYSIVTEAVQSEADASYDYPYLLDAFIANATGSIDVRIFYHDVPDVSGLIYRKFGPMTPGNGPNVWYNYPHKLSTTTIGGATVGLAEFTLTDNQQGDSDATVGRIVDPGGLAQLVTTSNPNCDIEYILTENNGVYEVSMLSNVTYTGSDNTIASMQVSLRAPTGVLTVDDSCILDTYGSTSFAVSTVVNPSETPGYDYISFNLGESFSTEIPFVAGQTIPLFTFKNIGTCTSTEDLYLVGPEGAIAVPTLANNNVTSQLTTAGGGVDQPVCVDDAAVSVVCQNSTNNPSPSNCGVEYILTETNGVYEVSMLSNVTYTGSDNTIASMQVTLRAPTGVLTVDDACILDTYGSTSFAVSTVVNPSETPGYDYISFNLGESFSTEIPFVTGQTVPLFTFKNIGICTSTEDLYLVGPEGAFAVPTLASNNVTSQLTTAGGGVDQPICVDDAAVSVACPNTTPGTCGVEYILTETDGVYEVSMLSNVTYTGSDNTIASMQVTLRAPTGIVTIDDSCILDTYGNTSFAVSTVVNPSETPGYDYISFNLGESFSTEIPFVTGQTVPLFTFKNIGTCTATEDLFLVGPEGAFAVPTLASNNVTSQLTTAGGGVDQPICVDATGVNVTCEEDGNTPPPVVPCQVEYILEENNGFYEVKMLSNVTWNSIERIISSMQVTVRAPTGLFHVENDCITPSIAGTIFEVGSTIINPTETPGFDYYSFNLTSFATNLIPFEMGDTVSLFTFKNLIECNTAGSIYLVGEGASFPTPMIPEHNLPSQLFTAGGGGSDTPVCVNDNAVTIVCPSTCPTIVLSGLSTNPSCTNDDGQILINTDASEALIYSIDAGTTWSTSGLFTNLVAGTYTIAIAALDTTCNQQGEILTLVAPTAPAITSVSATQPITCEGTGTIQILSSPASGIIYSVDGGSTWTTNNLFSDLAAGSYDIAIASADTSCIITAATEFIAGPTSPNITDEVVSQPNGCGQDDGLINISTVPSNGLIYSIDGGVTWSASSLFPNLGSGTYNISVAFEDTTCVTNGSTHTFVNPGSPVITEVQSENPSTCENTSGSITISSSPATGVIYSVDGGSTWSTSNIFTGLSADFYFVRVAYADTSCIVVGSNLSLVNPSTAVISGTTVTDPTNCDGTNGQIQINSIPATGLIYSIDGGLSWHTNSTITNVSTGTYTIAIANPDTTCMVIGENITINEIPNTIVSTINTNPSSPTAQDGCIEIITSCEDSFEYSNDGGLTWQSSNEFCDLGNGVYSVRVRCMDLSCSELEEEVDLGSSIVSCATIVTPVNNMTLCDENSTTITFEIDAPIASHTISGGTFTNEVVSGNTLTFNAQLNGLINFYTITVTTATGCELVEEFVLYQAENTEADFVVVEPFCKDGEVTIQFTGNATPNAILDWEVDGGTIVSTSPMSAFAPAANVITVSWDTEGSKLINLNVNDNGCTDDHVESIFVRKLPLVLTVGDTTICEGTCIDLYVGGTGVWYDWSPATGLSATDIPNPTACPTETTTYTVQVMGADGCMATESFTVSVEEVQITVGANADICIGASTTLSAGGGATYQWSPTTGLSDPTIANPTASPTVTTTYMVTVTTVNGCEAESAMTVTVHNPPTVEATGATEICEGESTTLGAGTFTQYLWSPSTGLSSTTAATPSASPTTTTTYTVTVTDNFGCTATDQVTVNVRPGPTVVPGPARTICRGQSVQISVTGTGTYSWSPTTNMLNPTTATPTVMPEVTTVYTAVVTDASGCTSSAAVTVNVEDLGVTAAVTSPLPLCPDELAQLNATGGTTYRWSPVEGLSNPNIANPTAQPLITTEYCVTVTRADGCFDIQCAQVTVDDLCTVPNCSITASPDVTICEGETTQLNVSEDMNIATTYVWSPSTGLSNPNIANPIASPSQSTAYTVTGTTAGGCITTDMVTVFVAEEPMIITYKNKEICEGDSIYLLVNGHSSYAWNNTNTMLYSTSEAPLVFPTTTTTYTVTVTGAGGCTNTEDILVNVLTDCDSTQPPNPPVCQVSGGPNVTICQGQTMLLHGTGAVTYSWSPTTGLDNPNTATPLAHPDVTTTYTVTGIDATGCISSAIVTVTVGGPRPFAIACEDKTICEGESIRLVVNNHSGYAWAPAANVIDANTGAPLVSPTVTTTYVVTVTNEFGCTDTDDVTVFVEDCNGTPPPITDTDPVVSCTTITVNAGNVLAACPGEGVQLNVTGGVNYAWSPAIGLSNPNIANPVANPTTSTTYSVTVTDANGCTGTDDVRVLVSLPITPDIIVTDASCCGTGGGSIQVSASGGFGDINYEWSSTGFFGNNISNLNSGLYTVTLTDVQGCSVAQTLTVGKSCDTCTPVFTDEMTCLEEGTTLSEICLPFAGADLENYTITVDGEVVNTMIGCDFENRVTYSYALVSSLNSNSNFSIQSWIVDGVTYNTAIMNISELTDWMNIIDPNGQWELNQNNQTLSGGVSTSTYGDMDIVDLSSTNEATLKANLSSIARGTLIEVDVSNGKDHQIIVENKLTCCVDELILSFCTQGQPCVSDMIAADLLELEVNNCNAVATFCVEIPSYEIDNYYISMDGSPYLNGVTACAFDENTDGSLLSLPEGYHELIFENRDNGCQDRLLVDVRCPSNVIIDTSLVVGTIGSLCLSDFMDTSTIVSVTQTCLLDGSDIISIVEADNYCWTYTGLAEGMDRFCVEVCTADGICFDIIQVVNILPEPDNCIGIIQEASLSATIDDCAGEAAICVNIPFDIILDYGIMLNGAPYRESMEACENGTIIKVGVGKHQLVISHLENDCEYILDLKVNCQTSVIELSETIELDETGTFCPESDELMGATISMINACPEESGTAVAVEMDDTNFCINFTGIEVGTERICLVVCDELEVCDTINYTINVIDKPLLFPIAVSDEDTTEVNRPITLIVTRNDSINGNLQLLEMVTEPQYGVARMNMDNTITYMPNTNYCDLDQAESFMYRICNEDGCDSAYITIRVPCLDLEVKTGFSPNGDGINDVFYIQGLQLYPDNELQVFSRWGNLVFTQKGYKNLWSGDWNNEELPDGTYFYILTLEEGTEPMKGYIQINR